MSLLDTLGAQLGGDTLRQISSQLGTDENTTQKAISAALPTLMGAMARNTAKPEGASNLHKALDAHDGSLLNNLSGFLGQSNAGPGQAILGHLLGGKQGKVEQGIGQASGLDSGKVGQLLTMLAPMVLAQLGKTKREQGLDPSALSGMLSGERSSMESKGGAAGMISGLLDADGDGDVDMSDIAKKGLGKLFGSN